MPGHNHYSWCDCGWCKGGSAPRATAINYRRSAWGPPLTHESITIPGASCPVCGAAVFYYQNASGSRVFFEHLGPPWTKHPCTDNPTERGSRTINYSVSDWIAERSSRTAIQMATDHTIEPRVVDGWIALRLRQIVIEDEWFVLKCERVENGQYTRVLVTEKLAIARCVPLYIRPWDVNGFTDVQYLDDELAAHQVWGWRYADWFAATPRDCVEARKKQDVCA